jgi:hypothetical protein
MSSKVGSGDTPPPSRKRKVKLQVPSKKCIPKWIPPEKIMWKDDESVPMDKKKWVDFRVVVPDEATKKQLLAAFEFIHDNNSVMDNDFTAVNSIAHSYLTPEREKDCPCRVIVDADLFKRMRQETCPHAWGTYFYDQMEFCKYCHKCMAVTSYRG